MIETRAALRRLLHGLLAPAVLLGLAIAVPVAALPEPVRAAPSRSRPATHLAPSQAGIVDAYVVSFGLWGPQSVFESEAKGAARVLAERLHASNRTIVRFNTKSRADATPERLAAALHEAAQAMDPTEDVLVLVLTSHGGPGGIGMVAGRDERLITPADLRVLLDGTGARYRVLIVSACYSGIFARDLADPRTLVITAAAADRPSFGCRDGATWTYFGNAFFNRALRAEPALDKAFAVARELVTRRERAEGFAPSLPQMAGGSEVLAKLADRASVEAATAACAGKPSGSGRRGTVTTARRPAGASGCARAESRSPDR